MCNIAVVSVHTSPLARPGTRDSGGMNVYIRELSRQLCRRAHTLDIFTRRTDHESPDVIEIDDLPPVTVFPTRGEAKTRSPLSEREPDARIAGERLVAQGADRVICASEGERRILIDNYGVSPQRAVQVPCGVETDHFRPMSRAGVRRRLGLPPDEPVLLYVGRIEPLKGIDILIRAAAQTEGRFRLLVVGGDSQDAERKDELRRAAAA